MLFNSNEFLFLFLPVSLLLYHLTRVNFGKNKAIYLLFFLSLFFYGYWEWRYVPLLLASIGVNLFLVRFIVKESKKTFLKIGITFNLLLLAVYKYLGFIELNIEAFTGSSINLPELVLPIGISFYTFQQIAYLVDVSRNKAVVRIPPSKYGLFICFFPQLIAGPIVHHKEMMPQFEEDKKHAELLKLACVGLVIFILGLSKKILIADPLGEFASPLFTRAEQGIDIHFFIAWSAAFAYGLQIYFDFSGYSEMAVGLALMFGIKLPTNFNSPYKSRSIIDFWRRWHMTLSRFLRDYLYFPLGGGRRSKARRYLNLMIVMLVGGLWHGASWTFAIWGGLHGLFLMINHGWRHLKSTFPSDVINSTSRSIAWPLTYLCAITAFVVFRTETLVGASNLYSAMIGLDGLSLPSELKPLLSFLGLDSFFYFFAENQRYDFYLGVLTIVFATAIALMGPNVLELLKRYKPTQDFETVEATFDKDSNTVGKIKLSKRYAILMGFLFYLSVKSINSASETEFLYFQF
jgi:D-alanyl-lipoteichoic acid acyltransferase DltB (MBOAT superfamily)